MTATPSAHPEQGSSLPRAASKDAPDLTLNGFHPAFADLADHIAAQRTGPHAAAFTPHRVFAIQAIAEIWRCAADNRTPRRHFVRLTRAEALEELALILDAADKRLTNRPDDRQRRQQRDQLAAMRWWHGHYPQSSGYALSMALTLRHEALRRAAEAETSRKAAA